MPTPVKMPRLGESVAEGTVGSWLKNEGDWVEKDESLVEIITDKINAELPSPIAGRLAKILVKADETVAVGVDIALIEENADVSASPTAEAAPGPDAAPVKSTAQAATPVMEPASSRAGNGASEGVSSQRGDEEERQRISPLARRVLDPGVTWWGWHVPAGVEAAVILVLGLVMLSVAIWEFSATE